MSRSSPVARAAPRSPSDVDEQSGARCRKGVGSPVLADAGAFGEPLHTMRACASLFMRACRRPYRGPLFPKRALSQYVAHVSAKRIRRQDPARLPSADQTDKDCVIIQDDSCPLRGLDERRG